jgi:hypothetical protein
MFLFKTPWSIPEALGALALAAAACSPAGPAPLTATSAGSCAESASRLERARRDLAEGRLLRLLAPELNDACPGEVSELLALARQAAFALGDPSAAPPRAAAGASAQLQRFGPDGPVEALPSAQERGSAYARAVGSWQAHRGADAARLAFAVGAGGGPLAAEAFILAARGAEQEGDGARARRMWARAYHAACREAPCAPRAPREGVVAAAVLLGRYIPWNAQDRCTFTLKRGPLVLGGTWLATASGEGIELRDMASRVLFERLEPPAGASFVCFSGDGQWRAAVSAAQGQGAATLHVARKDGAWSSTPLPAEFSGESLFHVGDDGRVVIPQRRVNAAREETVCATYAPGDAAARVERWSPPLDGLTGSLGPGGTYLSRFFERRGAKARVGVARYHFAQAEGRVLFEAKQEAEPGPADERGQVLALRDGELLWLDGASGKQLGGPRVAPFAAEATLGKVGTVPPSTVVWADVDARVLSLDIATGARAEVAVVSRLPRDSTAALATIAQLFRPLGLLMEGITWSARVDGAEIVLGGPGRPELRLTLTADRAGAMVIDQRGRFELLGSVSAAFRAAASCGPAAAIDGPWPLDVCAAALEEPGLIAAWIRTPPAPRPAPNPSTRAAPR